jgi:hypothetical protein
LYDAGQAYTPFRAASNVSGSAATITTASGTVGVRAVAA